MYREMAMNLPVGFPCKDFLKVQEVLFCSNIRTKLQDCYAYNFLTEIHNSGLYEGKTFFIGYTNSKNWISLNILENVDKLFIHSNIKIPNQSDVAKNYAEQGFPYKGRHAHLYEVGSLSDPVQTLIKAVNDIVANLQ